MQKESTLESEFRGAAASDEACRLEEQDINWLIDHLPEYQSVSCPACGSDSLQFRFAKHRHCFDECQSCGTVFLNPRPSSRLLDEYYQISKSYAFWNDVIYPQSEASRLLKIIIPRVDRILEIAARHHCGHGGLIDIGAGFGSFCGEVQRRSFFDNVVALEPNPFLAESCRAKGIATVDQPIETANLSGVKIDMAVAFEVIEHLHEPIDLIRRVHRILPGGGLLVLTCPNVCGFDMQMLQEHSSSVDPRHLNLFNPRSLAILLQRCGFEVIDTLTPGLLDAELVRKELLSGEVPMDVDPFLKQVLLDDWDRLGVPFQKFLADNVLSSHLWIIGKKH
jgi:SAM-dependent methyltransferase